MFYEDGNEYISLKITLLDEPGYYIIFNDNCKTMNFKLDGDSLRKIIEIFDHIGEILNIDFYHHLNNDNNGITYFLKKYMMIPVLENTRIKQLIQFQMKRASIIVEYYYKYNLFTTIIIRV